ncbi:MAG: hypothetical protein AB1445_14605 [Bacillota bacterium]
MNDISSPSSVAWHWHGRDEIRADIRASLDPLVQECGVEADLECFGSPAEVAEAFAAAGFGLRRAGRSGGWRYRVAVLVLAALAWGYAALSGVPRPRFPLWT